MSPIGGPELVFLGAPNQHRRKRIELDVHYDFPIFISAPDPPIMKSCMPNWEPMRVGQSDSVRCSAFNHLNGLFDCGALVWRNENVDVVRHDHEGVQFVKSAIPTLQNLLKNNLRSFWLCENGTPFPGITRDKINTGLANSPDNPAHSRGQGLKPFWTGSLCRG